MEARGISKRALMCIVTLQGGLDRLERLVGSPKTQERGAAVRVGICACVIQANRLIGLLERLSAWRPWSTLALASTSLRVDAIWVSLHEGPGPLCGFSDLTALEERLSGDNSGARIGA